MSILLRVLQVLMALHTGVGAIWKFSKTAEQTMPSLKAIPNSVWMGMSIVELFCALAFVLPFFNKSLKVLAPVAAIVIIVEMLAFCVIHLYSGDASYGPIIYWMAVALICSFIAYKRLK